MENRYNNSKEKGKKVIKDAHTNNFHEGYFNSKFSDEMARKVTEDNDYIEPKT